MTKTIRIAAVVLVSVSALVSSARAQTPAKISTQTVDAYVKNTWKSPPEGWRREARRCQAAGADGSERLPGPSCPVSSAQVAMKRHGEWTSPANG